MNRKWWKFCFFASISVCTLYAGGYAAQFIKTIRNGLLQETLPATEPIRKQLLYTHWSAFTLPLPISRWFLVWDFFLPGSLWASYFLLMRMGYDRNGEISDHDRNLNYSTKGTCGTSSS